MNKHLGSCARLLVLTLVLVAGMALADDAPPADPASVLAPVGPDSLRSNLMVAEALLGDAMDEIAAALPAGPVAVVLVPGSTEAAAELLTVVATHRLLAAGHQVHLDHAPAGTAGPVFELRYRINQLDLTYPDSGRRFLLWNSWVDRSMDLVVNFALVNAADNEVLVSRRVVRRFQDRMEAGQREALESPIYPFTIAEVEGGGWTRRLEQIAVLGTLAGLVAVYFANTE